MSESSVVLTLKDHLSSGFNSIANALTGFNKKQEEARKKAADLSKTLDAEKDNLAKFQREYHEAQKKLKEFKKTHEGVNDELSNSAFEAAQREVNDYAEQVAAAKTNIKELGAEIKSLDGIQRRSSVFGGNNSGGTSSKTLLKNAEYAQLAKMLGESLGGAANASISSALGDDTGNVIGSVLSGAASGIATGAVAGGPWGALIGGIVGIASGAISAGTQIFEKKDQYYKNSVQESYEGFKQAREEMVTSGSSVAAGREVDELAFNKLLGDGVGTEYLADLRDLAAHTPLEYDQLTEISRQLAIGFGDESDRMLELIEVVGDAGSAVGLDSSGMVTIATALSRMQSSDKVTLEYLNLIQERGIDAIGIIGQAKGLTTAQVYDAISKGSLDGSDIVDILQEGMGEKYGGSMEEQAQTYQGLSSTLEDQETERESIVGDAYTETRKPAMESEISFNDSELGQKISEIRGYEGELAAMAVNLQNNYKNRALEFVLTGQGSIQGWDTDIVDELQARAERYAELEERLTATNDIVEQSSIKAEMGAILDLAESLSQQQYELSEYCQGINAVDLVLLDGLQAAEALGDNETGYRIGNELSQGIAAGMSAHSALIADAAASAIRAGIAAGTPADGGNSQNGTWRRRVVKEDGSSAYGLNRVPYNGYIAKLHEGERVLTAQQARQMDAGGYAGGVVITGNNFTVREDADVTRIATELVRQIRAAQMVYAGG